MGPQEKVRRLFETKTDKAVEKTLHAGPTLLPSSFFPVFGVLFNRTRYRCDGAGDDYELPVEKSAGP